VFWPQGKINLTLEIGVVGAIYFYSFRHPSSVFPLATKYHGNIYTPYCSSRCSFERVEEPNVPAEVLHELCLAKAPHPAVKASAQHVHSTKYEWRKRKRKRKGSATSACRPKGRWAGKKRRIVATDSRSSPPCPLNCLNVKRRLLISLLSWTLCLLLQLIQVIADGSRSAASRRDYNKTAVQQPMWKKKRKKEVA
jgi:hypothetical protein